MTLSKNQDKPGPTNINAPNTKKDATGRPSGLGPNQDRAGYPHEKVSKKKEKGGADPGPQDRRGYVRNQPNANPPTEDGNLAPDGTRTITTSDR